MVSNPQIWGGTHIHDIFMSSQIDIFLRSALTGFFICESAWLLRRRQPAAHRQVRHSFGPFGSPK